jgi:chemotaxis protein CheX
MASAIRQVDPIGVYGQSMHEAVEEVFSLMMGMSCVPVDDCPIEEPETISAVIGLAGALTGIEMKSLDDTVKDAIGEICNMVAGAWKGKLSILASSCMLSTPTVVTGSNYQLHTQRPEFRLEHYYRFENLTFAITLVCESMQ